MKPGPVYRLVVVHLEGQDRPPDHAQIPQITSPEGIHQQIQGLPALPIRQVTPDGIPPFDQNLRFPLPLVDEGIGKFVGALLRPRQRAPKPSS